ncbi:MAG: glycosyltransferase [Candidatus Thiothrix putei]|uniref:Glycosyltransferase n=1 Tax=Candidatus Thiothrix putei TaxID=3080811 RepID=A0AA95KRQ1_9GAMM|nr:MAG: glycosyltransferase [Candidatus Thiothrix putei]
MIKIENTCAVITTFSPNRNIVTNVKIISPQVNKVFIINDSGDNNKKEWLESTFSDNENIILIHNIFNIGIAASLNVAIRAAEKSGYMWFITFDDDTTIKTDSICRLMKEANNSNIPQKEKNLFSLARPSHYRKDLKDNELYEKMTTITSGCLFSASLFNSINGFDERFFIDMVDFDFCLRARKNKSKVFILNYIDMNHTLGNSQIIKFLGKNIESHSHPAFRLYYHYRNSIKFTSRHFTYFPKLVTKVWIMLLLTFIKILLFDDKKIKKVKFIIIGLYHGLRSRYGKIPSSIT